MKYGTIATLLLIAWILVYRSAELIGNKDFASILIWLGKLED